MKAPKELPDIDEAAKFLLIGMIFDGVAKSVTLSNDTILEYWPPKEGKKQHILNLKIYGKERGLGTRQTAIAINAILAALELFGREFGSIDGYTDFGGTQDIYAEWKCHSYGWEVGDAHPNPNS